MIKVTLGEVIPEPKPDVTIVLDYVSAKKIADWLAREVNPPTVVHNFWDALDDVVNLDYPVSEK